MTQESAPRVVETIKPYDAEGDKKPQIAGMFDNIAKRYDLLNRILSMGIDKTWRKRVVKMMRPHEPKHILDVATGTADLALDLAKQLKPDHVRGLDISPKMLEFGREKVKKADLDPIITLEVGDSENMPYEDNTFDAVTVSFGVRNFQNLNAGLSEMYRVLRPGGQLIVLEFSEPTGFPLKQLFHFYFKYILPTIGRITSKDKRAYTYLYESVQAFPSGQKFADVLSSLDFKSVTCTPFTIGICSAYSAYKPS